MIIGITGGTGSGKTTLLHTVAAAGGLVLDCDEIYHRLLSTDAVLLAEIEKHFPGTVEKGSLNRPKLGSMVFSDPVALETLNRITHGAVKAEVLRLLQQRPQLTAIDAIGLFEGGLAELCDVTVAVTAPADVRLRRLMERDRISAEYAHKRIAAQHTDSWFCEKCDRVLVNDGTPEQFQRKCIAFLTDLGIMEA